MYAVERNVLLVDDHPLLRDGIHLTLKMHDGLTKFIIAESGNALESLNELKNNKYDLVILDYHIKDFNPDELVNRIISLKSNTKILILSNHDETSQIKKIIRSGANGYLLKNCEKKELIKAIQTILNGEHYFSEEIIRKLGHEIIKQEKSEITRQGNSVENPQSHLKIVTRNTILTQREIEVVKLITKQITSVEIARRLHISKRTVDTHRQNILKKLGLKGTLSLIKYAIKNDLI